MFKKTINIDNYLRPFADDAVARLNYLFSDIRFILVKDTIEIQSDQPVEEEKLSQEISYTLYRAKIRHEGSANRAALYSAVFGR